MNGLSIPKEELTKEVKISVDRVLYTGLVKAILNVVPYEKTIHNKVTHDEEVKRIMAHRVVAVYNGKIVYEFAPIVDNAMLVQKLAEAEQKLKLIMPRHSAIEKGRNDLVKQLNKLGFK